MTDPKQVEVLKEKATYEIPQYEVTNEGLKECEAGRFIIEFCKGNKADETVFRQRGVFTESLVAVAIKYLQDNNVGELQSRETSIAITHLETGLLWLQKRAEDRKARGVQGTYQK